MALEDHRLCIQSFSISYLKKEMIWDLKRINLMALLWDPMMSIHNLVIMMTIWDKWTSKTSLEVKDIIRILSWEVQVSITINLHNNKSNKETFIQMRHIPVKARVRNIKISVVAKLVRDLCSEESLRITLTRTTDIKGDHHKGSFQTSLIEYYFVENYY